VINGHAPFFSSMLIRSDYLIVDSYQLTYSNIRTCIHI